jgi:hypothetical protein
VFVPASLSSLVLCSRVRPEPTGVEHLKGPRRENSEKAFLKESLKKNLSYLKILMIKIEYRVPHYKSDVDFSSLP